MSGARNEPINSHYLRCRYLPAGFHGLPVLVRDDKKPDDVDTTQEDHDYDATRYRVLHSPKKVGAIFF